MGLFSNSSIVHLILVKILPGPFYRLDIIFHNFSILLDPSNSSSLDSLCSDLIFVLEIYLAVVLCLKSLLFRGVERCSGGRLEILKGVIGEWFCSVSGCWDQALIGSEFETQAVMHGFYCFGFVVVSEEK
jgi:hypothetical protein